MLNDWDAEVLFICACCQGPAKDWGHCNGRDRQLAPVCLYCEGSRIVSVCTGAFMDRRKVRQGLALSEHLLGEANCIKYERETHGKKERLRERPGYGIARA